MNLHEALIYRALFGGGGSGDPNIIHFTVTISEVEDGEYAWYDYECTADKGMTFGEWAASDYNIFGAYDEDGQIVVSDAYSGVVYLGAIDEVIIDGSHYSG